MFTNPQAGDFVRIKRSYQTTDTAGRLIIVPRNRLHRVVSTRSPRGRDAPEICAQAGIDLKPACFTDADLAGFGTDVMGDAACYCQDCLASEFGFSV